MNINFEDHILELLNNNQCVVLPGFGGFILKGIPSIIHQHTISPPSKQIAFNSALVHDDELLTGALMGKHNLSYETAKNKVLAYSNQISYTLKKDSSVSLKKIGSFSVNEQNQIIFKPFVLEFADKAAFGLQKFHVKPIAKQIIREPVKRVAQEINQAKTVRKEQARKKSKLPVVGLVSSVILMAGIFGLIGTNTSIAPAKTQQAGFVEMFFPNDSFVESFDNTERISFENTNTPVPQKEGYLKGGLIDIARNDLAKGYYIVLGSYASRKNAERMEAQLFAEGKDSYIFPSDNGFFRVGVYADKNFLTAKNMLAENNLDTKGAWLLKN